MDQLMKIRRVGRGPKDLRVSCRINTEHVIGVLDTAADVTVISEDIYEKMSIKPKITQQINLKAAGEDQIFGAKMTEPIRLQIGSEYMMVSVYVAKINDPMLIGLDVLKGMEAKIDVGKREVTFRNQKMKMDGQTEHEELEKDKLIKIRRMIKIPSRSEVIVKIEKKHSLKDVIFEPSPDLGVGLACSIHKGDQDMTLSFINLSSRQVKLREGTEIGKINTVEWVDGNEKENQEEKETKMEKKEEARKSVEEMLEELLEKADDTMKKMFNEQQTKRAKKILLDNKEVFAKHSYDLGCFEKITHKIDVGNATPVKEGLRRTPIQYIQAENNMIQQMQINTKQNLLISIFL